MSPITEKKKARLKQAQAFPLFNQLCQLHKLLKVYSTLDKNEAWQQIVTYGGKCVSLKALAVMLNTPESNAHKKLKPLREVGLVTYTESGKLKCFAPVMDVCLRVEAFLTEAYHGKWNLPCAINDTKALSSPLTFYVWVNMKMQPAPMSTLEIARLLSIASRESISAIMPAVYFAFDYTELDHQRRYYSLPLVAFFAALQRTLIDTGTIKSGAI